MSVKKIWIWNFAPLWPFITLRCSLLNNPVIEYTHYVYLLGEDYFFHCSISLNPHSSKASEYLYQYCLRVILFFSESQANFQTCRYFWGKDIVCCMCVLDVTQQKIKPHHRQQYLCSTLVQTEQGDHWVLPASLRQCSSKIRAVCLMCTPVSDVHPSVPICKLSSFSLSSEQLYMIHEVPGPGLAHRQMPTSRSSKCQIWHVVDIQ